MEIEPFGTEIDLLGHGIVASTLANVNRDPKRRPQPYQPSDFIPKFGGSDLSDRTGSRKPLTDPKEWKRNMSMLSAMMEQDK